MHTEAVSVNADAPSALELPEMLRRTTRELVRALNAHSGAAWHLSQTGDQLVPVAGYRIPKQVLQTALTATIPVTSADPLIRDATHHRRPIYSSDSAKDPRFQYSWAGLLPHKSVLVLPLALPSTGKIIGGVAIVWTEEGHEFRPDEIRLAEAIAQQAGSAVENARLLSELRSRERRLQEVLQANRELFSPQATVFTLAKTIADIAVRLVNGDRADVRVAPAPDSGPTEAGGFQAAVGLAAKDDRGTGEWAHFADRISATIAGTGEPIFIRAPRPGTESTDTQAALNRLGYRGLLAVPLKLGSVLHGTLTIAATRPEGFSAADLSTVTAFAMQAALAIDSIGRSNLVNHPRAEPAELPTAPGGGAGRLGPARQLARGVAHIFNNSLSVIVGRAQLALRLPPTDPDLRRQLEAIQQAALESAETVRRLQLSSGARVAPSHRSILPAELFAEIQESFEAQLKRAPASPHSTVVEIQDVGSIPAIAGDLAELREALTNLLVNALEAMPTGGTIRLTAASEQGVVRMTVEDTGPGMAAGVAARIFEPFFTTKGPAHAGLGLGLVSTVVERHSGSLTVETTEGKGTTFTIRLPLWIVDAS